MEAPAGVGDGHIGEGKEEGERRQVGGIGKQGFRITAAEVVRGVGHKGVWKGWWDKAAGVGHGSCFLKCRSGHATGPPLQQK